WLCYSRVLLINWTHSSSLARCLGRIRGNLRAFWFTSLGYFGILVYSRRSETRRTRLQEEVESIRWRSSNHRFLPPIQS
ncbi:hypothetical protein PFISCL1PPCAC_10084, partial [Pristionchus fissidentatus]